MKKYYVTLLLSLLFSSNVFALAGDAESGKAKSAMCAGCHGADGNSLVAMYPKLAGQSEKYITKQLADFKKGMTSGGTEGRVDPVMGGMTMALSPQDMADLAAYYSTQKITSNNSESSELGKKIYQGGNTELAITACAACHGITGQGMPDAGFPALASQNEEYIKNQMLKFRDGTRANDKNSMMRNIAINLEDEQLNAIAKYISSMK